MGQQAPTTAMGNILAARVAAQARGHTPSQPRPAANLTPIRVAAPPLPPPSPQQPTVLPAGQLALPELDQQFRGAVKTARNSLAAIAYYGFRLLLANDWSSLGYDSAEHYYTEQGLSQDIWENYTKLGERLQHLSLTDMQQLRVSAARALAKVHPSLWPEYAWVEEAKLLPTREFEVLVIQRNREHQPSQLAEPRITVSVSVPVSQQSTIERRMQSLRRRAKLATPGDTLIFALEAADRASLMEDVLSAVQQQVAELGRLWKPDEPWSVALAESVAERADRLEHGAEGQAASLVDAGARSQQLTRAILRQLRELDLQPKGDPASYEADQEAIRTAPTPIQRQAS